MLPERPRHGGAGGGVAFGGRLDGQDHPGVAGQLQVAAQPAQGVLQLAEEQAGAHRDPANIIGFKLLVGNLVFRNEALGVGVDMALDQARVFHQGIRLQVQADALLNGAAQGIGDRLIAGFAFVRRHAHALGGDPFRQRRLGGGSDTWRQRHEC